MINQQLAGCCIWDEKRGRTYYSAKVRDLAFCAVDLREDESARRPQPYINTWTVTCYYLKKSLANFYQRPISVEIHLTSSYYRRLYILQCLHIIFPVFLCRYLPIVSRQFLLEDTMPVTKWQARLDMMDERTPSLLDRDMIARGRGGPSVCFIFS